MPNRIIKITATQSLMSPPEPVALEAVKEWCIVGHNEDDAIFTALITQVRKHAEAYTKSCLIDYTIELLINCCKAFELPRTPYKAITKVEIKNGADWDILTTDDYEVIGEQFIPKRLGILKITYTAGYSGSVPESISLAILNEVAYRYENRGDNDITAELSPAFERYLSPFINLAWQ